VFVEIKVEPEEP